MGKTYRRVNKTKERKPRKENKGGRNEVKQELAMFVRK